MLAAESWYRLHPLSFLEVFLLEIIDQLLLDSVLWPFIWQFNISLSGLSRGHKCSLADVFTELASSVFLNVFFYLMVVQIIEDWLVHYSRLMRIFLLFMVMMPTIFLQLYSLDIALGKFIPVLEYYWLRVIALWYLFMPHFINFITVESLHGHFRDLDVIIGKPNVLHILGFLILFWNQSWRPLMLVVRLISIGFGLVSLAIRAAILLVLLLLFRPPDWQHDVLD